MKDDQTVAELQQISTKLDALRHDIQHLLKEYPPASPPPPTPLPPPSAATDWC